MDSQQPESFDPYLKWLGIRDPDRPINHYRLLGIDLLESDPDVIAVAADRQMSHVRRYQSGKQAQVSQEILNELAAAKLVLLDPDRKAQYDAQFTREAIQNPNTRNRWSYVVPAVLAGFATIAVAISWHGTHEPKSTHHAVIDDQSAVAQSPDESQPEQPEAGRTKEPTARERTVDGDKSEVPTLIDEARLRAKRDDEPTTITVAPPVLDQQPTNEPAPEFVEVSYPFTPLPIPPNSACYDVKLYLSEGKTEAAKQELRDVRSEMRTPTDEECHRALFQIANLIEPFWRAVGTACQGGIPRTMLDYAGTPVTVQAVDGRIVLRSPNGAQIDYPAQPRKLPPLVAAMLAQKILEDRSDLHTILWAFWAFDERGNAEQASFHSQHARRYESSSIVPQLQKAWETTSGPGERVAADKRLEIPDEREIRLLKRTIESALGIERRHPTSDAPEKFLRYASSHADEPDIQYVCYQEALHYATRMGRADLAIKTLNDITDTFGVDEAHTKRLDVLQELSRNATDARSAGLIASAAQAAARHRIVADDFTQATKFAAIFSRSADRSNNPNLVKQAAATGKRVKILAREHRKIVAAKQALEIDLTDEVANMQIGRFYCLAKGDFSKGLPYLANSGRSELAILARNSLVPSKSLEARIDIADRWWDMAETLRPFERLQARQYAVQLYRMLQPETFGPLRVRVTSRLRSHE